MPTFKAIHTNTRIGRILRSKLFIAAMVVSTAGFGLAGANHAAAAAVQDCSDNSIIRCGSQTPADFVTKLQANNPSDLQGLYDYFGLPSADYANFASNAKMGTAYKDGRIVVDGKVVATDAFSLGREKKSYSTPYDVNGYRYYKSMNKDVFVPDSIPAMVYFDNSGSILFAVLTACGNPLGGTPVKETPKPQPEPPKPQQPTASFQCTGLTATGINDSTNGLTYVFRATAAASNASLSATDFDFGDGSMANNVGPESGGGLSSTITHSFPKAGGYTVKATLHFSAQQGSAINGSQTATCSTYVTVNQVQPVAAPAAAPTAPATMPNTGAGDVAAYGSLFSGASAIGALGYRWRNQRRIAKIDRLFGLRKQ